MATSSACCTMLMLDTDLRVLRNNSLQKKSPLIFAQKLLSRVAGNRARLPQCNLKCRYPTRQWAPTPEDIGDAPPVRRRSDSESYQREGCEMSCNVHSLPKVELEYTALYDEHTAHTAALVLSMTSIRRPWCSL
jgi:hypothetical protein